MNQAIAPFTPLAGPASAVPGMSNAQPADEALREALIDSRQRWRDLVSMAADIVFETDSWGRFVFLGPDTVLGWQSSTLLGQPAELLLAESGGSTGFNPFRITAPIRRRRAWLRRPDGTSVCVTIAAAPLVDAEGHVTGTRGLGQDVTEQDIHDGRITAALRRGELLDHILWHMRQEVMADKMMKAALEALVTALGAEGCAVIDMLGDGVASSVLHKVGHPLPDVLNTAMNLLESGDMEPSHTNAPDGHLVLVCPSRQNYSEQAGFAIWRPPGARIWDEDELALAGSATGIIRVILEHDTIQREMARQARTDPLTGLLNRRAFLDEVGRRVERLEREELPGTLMFIDLDNFKLLNDQRGHDVGDEALCLVAGLLRQTVRPADLVARLGGDEFALWMDGADELTAAERAESLRTEGPATFTHLTEGDIPGQAPSPPLTMSIGIATRWPGQGEDIDMLINRADQVMYEVKRSGRAHWRVSRVERV